MGLCWQGGRVPEVAASEPHRRACLPGHVAVLTAKFSCNDAVGCNLGQHQTRWPPSTTQPVALDPSPPPGEPFEVHREVHLPPTQA